MFVSPDLLNKDIAHTSPTTCVSVVQYIVSFYRMSVSFNSIYVTVKFKDLKVHKRENFLGSDFEICTFS